MSDISIGTISASVGINLNGLKQATQDAIGSFNKIDNSIKVSCGSITQNIRIMAAAAKTDLEKAAEANRKLAQDAEKAARQMQQAYAQAVQGFKSLSNAAFNAGGAIARGFQQAIQKSVEFEAAFVGVRKALNATEPEFAALRKQLEGLTQKLPTDFKTIAGIAENAAQLGIAKNDISAFTEVIAGLAATTNLTADMASSSMARIANVLQLPASQYKQFADTVVQLGLAGASTERDIVQLANRLSGAGKLVGIPTQEILAFSAAMSDVGIRAESGGTAMSGFFKKVSSAVISGGKDLKAFAEITGVSQAQFKQLWNEDKGRAINAFITGLRTLKDRGADVNTILKTMGINNSRTQDSLLKLAGAGDALSKQLDNAQRGWNGSNALQQKVDKQMQSTQSQTELLRNQIDLLEKEIGDKLLPTFRNIVSQVSAAVKWFSNLSDGTRSNFLKLAEWSGGILLAVGIIGKFVSGLMAIRDAYLLVAGAAGIARAAQVGAGAAGAAGGVSGAVGRNAIGGGAGGTAAGIGLGIGTKVGVVAAIAAGWMGYDAAQHSIEASEAQDKANALPDVSAFATKILKLREQLKADPSNLGLKKQIEETTAAARRMLPDNAQDIAAKQALKATADAKKASEDLLRQLGGNAPNPHFNADDFKKTKKGKKEGKDEFDYGEQIAAALDNPVHLDDIDSTCANFVKKILQRVGLAFATSDSAHVLIDQMVKNGANKVTGQMQKGDILYFTGAGYGNNPKDKPSDRHHIGIYEGEGKYSDSPHKGDIRRHHALSDYDMAHVQAYRFGTKEDRIGTAIDNQKDIAEKAKESAKATQEANDRIFETQHAQAEIAIRDAGRERDEQIKNGADKQTAYRAYSIVVQQIEAETAQKIRQQQNEQEVATQNSQEKLEKGYRDAGEAAAAILEKLDDEKLAKAEADASAEYAWTEEKFRAAYQERMEQERQLGQLQQVHLQQQMGSLDQMNAGQLQVLLGTLRQIQDETTDWTQKWIELPAQIAQVNDRLTEVTTAPQRQMAARFRESVQQMAQSVQSVLGGAFEAVFDGKDFFKSLLTGFTQMLKQMVAQAIAAGIVKLIFGAATGGGSSLLGGFFGFDDAVNDNKAARWGYDFSHHFTNGINQQLNAQKPFTGLQNRSASNGGGDTHINLHMQGMVIREDADIPKLADAVAWRMQSRLRGAYVGS